MPPAARLGREVTAQTVMPVARRHETVLPQTLSAKPVWRAPPGWLNPRNCTHFRAATRSILEKNTLNPILFEFWGLRGPLRSAGPYFPRVRAPTRP